MPFSRGPLRRYLRWHHLPVLQARPLVLPNLKPSLRTISLRLPEHLLAELKVLANKRDLPYQSLLKQFLAERIEEELRGRATEEIEN